jgi:hypothetical protein
MTPREDLPGYLTSSADLSELDLVPAVARPGTRRALCRTFKIFRRAHGVAKKASFVGSAWR